MVKYFERHKSEFMPLFVANKRVIELGSGTGLLGIALALLGANIVFTDLKPMLEILDRNVKLNIVSNSYRVKVQELSWGANARNGSPFFDIIVASDVTYEDENIEPLIATLCNLSGPDTVIYIGAEVRKMQAEDIFKNNATHYFDIEMLETEGLDEAFADINVAIYKLRKKYAEISNSPTT